MTWLVELQGLNLYMTEPHPDGYKLSARANGRDWGNPAAVIDAIQSQLMDGSLAKIGKFDNRAIILRIKIEAPGAPDPGAVLAKGELALIAATRWAGYGVLRLRPDMEGARTAVAEVVTGYPDLEASDAYIENSETPYRVYQLTLNARPFVRPETRVQIAAPPTIPATPNDTTVDTGSSSTGWTLLTAAPSAWRNEITNPSFETSTAGWTPGTGTSSIIRQQAAGGTWYALITSATNAFRSYANAPVPAAAAAGTEYTYGMTVRSPGGLGGFLIKFFNAAGAQVGPDHGFSATFPGSGFYTWNAGKLTAPATATTQLIEPWMNGTPAPIGSIGEGRYSWLLDRVWAVSGGATTYFDGTNPDTPARNYAWTGPTNLSASSMTWASPGFGVVTGAIQATMWGRNTVAVRRTGAITMTTQPYLRLTGQAFWDVNGTPKSTGIALTFTIDGTTVTPDGFTLSASGDWTAILHLPNGVASTVDVTATGSDPTVPDKGIRVRVGTPAIVKTDRPIAGTGRAQVRQVPIYGAMRTEMSLLIEGRDTAGNPADVGPQVLLTTASGGDDSAAQFLTLRQYGPTGISDSTSIGGSYSTLNTIVGTPLAFEFPAGILTRGNYRTYLEVQPTAAGPFTLFHRVTVIPTGQPALAASDPVAGWKQVPLNVGATWPAVPLNTWRLIPLQLMAFPPGDVEGAATIRVELAASVGGQVRVGEGIAVNITSGDVTLVDTSGGVSAVRLDAATVDNPDPTIWIGVAGGVMVQAPMTRIQAFGVHRAEPPFASIGSVTPACGSSQLSAEYPDRYHSHVAPRPNEDDGSTL